MDAGEGPDAWDSPPGPDDHAAVDLLAQDGVRAADVPGAFGGDGGGFDPETELAKGFRRLEDDLVPGLPALLQREVEVALCDLQSEHVGLEQAQRLAKQLLPGLVAVEHGDGRRGHRSNHMARSALVR